MMPASQSRRYISFTRDRLLRARVLVNDGPRPVPITQPRNLSIRSWSAVRASRMVTGFGPRSSIA
jgi:hypothetical protein